MFRRNGLFGVVLPAAACVLASAGLGARADSGSRPNPFATRDGWRQAMAGDVGRAPADRAPPPPPPPQMSLFRSYDGTGNNPGQPAWGSAGTNYLREASGAHYADGLSAPAGASRPGARAISNLIVDQAGHDTADRRGLSTCMYEFGQFLDHDIGLAKGGSAEAFDIPVPAGDPYFDPASTGTRKIFLDRSAFDPATGTTGPRQQINAVTSFIDGSQIYGSDGVRAAWLRAGVGGRLKSRATPQGEMLPLNDGTMSNDNPVGAPAGSLVVAGDVRANEQPGLTALHTVFLREHNFQAGRLAALNPTWDDERIFQEARRFVIAELQVITYREFLPSLLGRQLPPYQGYRPDANPGLSNLFATAAYRMGHSQVGPDIEILDADFREVGVLDLADVFFSPSTIPSQGGIDPFIRYMVSSVQQETDSMIVDPLRNFLFGPPGAGGFDLGSLNIQRGRDHGLGDYNTVRADFGLPRVASFSQISSSPTVAAKLQALYGSVDSIDPWVGMLAEDHAPGASVGATHLAVIIDQFIRLRDGDRLWYQNTPFPPSELALIEGTRLSDVFKRNTGITKLQPNVFFAAEINPACPGDLDGNGTVGANDLSVMLASFGATPGSPNWNRFADIDSNGVVGANDLSVVLAKFGGTCP
ncbi:MAG: peroxidase [Phycisphaerales bacterium]|nr:peroxidase [Phycisphaerales bacterium]